MVARTQRTKRGTTTAGASSLKASGVVPKDNLISIRTKLEDVSIRAMIAVYDGILKGLKEIDSPKVRSRYYPRRPLPPDLKKLAQEVRRAKYELERKFSGRIFLPLVVSEVSADYLINQSRFLDEKVKEIMKWYIATTPISDKGLPIFAQKADMDTTGLAELVQKERDLRAEVLVI